MKTTKCTQKKLKQMKIHKWIYKFVVVFGVSLLLCVLSTVCKVAMSHGFLEGCTLFFLTLKSLDSR